VSLWVDGIAMLEHADPDVGWATAGPAPVSVVANTPAATKATSDWLRWWSRLRRPAGRWISPSGPAAAPWLR
jgi:hypothetical protein